MLISMNMSVLKEVKFGSVSPGHSSTPLPARSVSRTPKKSTNQGRRNNVIRAAKEKVEYGSDWYTQTKKYGVKQTSSKKFYDNYKAANEAANNGKERKDLYTDNWEGDVYKGKRINILTVLILFAVGTPVAGLVFAYATYGKLWG
mmetsp:Transcript_34466/g.47755  ORF Transcript_34466/g.47755 Transcript_34466/m.47755 type:complete len:145 (+) Transcript_34466:73-507(+)